MGARGDDDEDWSEWRDQDDSLKVFVSRLPVSVDDQTLHSAFGAKYGHVVEAHVCMASRHRERRPSGPCVHASPLLGLVF